MVVDNLFSVIHATVAYLNGIAVEDFYKGLSGQQRIFCPQEGSQMDSQSKPRRSVINCREVIGGQGRTTF